MTTKIILAAVITTVVYATCYAKEDYKDPQKFAEKYVREDVERRYPGKIYNPVLQYKGFELVNVQSEMNETLSGPTSLISCEFRVVPERGVEYYLLDNSFRWVDSRWFGWFPNEAASAGLTEERIKSIDGKIRAFCERHPLMVKKTDITPKPGYAKHMIYVYRTRNEDGIFVPMRAAGAGSVFRYEGVGGWYNSNELFCAKMAKARGAFDSASEEGRNAYVTYSNKCEKFGCVEHHSLKSYERFACLLRCDVSDERYNHDAACGAA